MPAADGKPFARTTDNATGINMFLWDFRNRSAADYFVDRVAASAAASTAVDGVFFDDMLGACCNAEGSYNQTLWDRLPVSERRAMCDATITTFRRTAQQLIARGKVPLFSAWHHSVTLPRRNATRCVLPRSQIEAGLGHGWARFDQGIADPFWGEPCEELIADTRRDADSGIATYQWAHLPKVDLKLSLAVFLIGLHHGSFFGASTGWNTADWRWHPQFDADYGVPRGRAVRNATTGAWTRNFTKCRVEVQCRTKTARLEFV
jgi:hypothetical protein